MTTPDERRKLIAELGDLLPADLKVIAAMPIMDPGRLYLPAGRVTETEAQAREAKIKRGEPL